MANDKIALHTIEDVGGYHRLRVPGGWIYLYTELEENDTGIALTSSTTFVPEPSEARWIPVGERLPEDGAQVALLFEHQPCCVSWRESGEWWPDEPGDPPATLHPTHWTALPEPPERSS